MAEGVRLWKVVEAILGQFDELDPDQGEFVFSGRGNPRANIGAQPAIDDVDLKREILPEIGRNRSHRGYETVGHVTITA